MIGRCRPGNRPVLTAMKIWKMYRRIYRTSRFSHIAISVSFFLFSLLTFFLLSTSVVDYAEIRAQSLSGSRMITFEIPSIAEGDLKAIRSIEEVESAVFEMVTEKVTGDGLASKKPFVVRTAFPATEQMFLERLKRHPDSAIINLKHDSVNSIVIGSIKIPTIRINTNLNNAIVVTDDLFESLSDGKVRGRITMHTVVDAQILEHVRDGFARIGLSSVTLIPSREEDVRLLESKGLFYTQLAVFYLLLLLDQAFIFYYILSSRKDVLLLFCMLGLPRGSAITLLALDLTLDAFLGVFPACIAAAVFFRRSNGTRILVHLLEYPVISAVFLLGIFAMMVITSRIVLRGDFREAGKESLYA